MTEYYFDVETQGLDPRIHKIVTIQFQQLGKTTGKPLGDLQILKEWELTEKIMIKKFLGLFATSIWVFIPIGLNLAFDFNFIKERTKIVLGKEIPLELLYQRPYIDIKSILIIWNRGNFRGSGLHSILDDTSTGKKVSEWYKNKEHKKIISYIEEEAEAFIRTYQKIKTHIPTIQI